jgi:hypothetical protein
VLRRKVVLLLVCSAFLIGLTVHGGIPFSFGFGVRAPASLPIDWDQSFSFLSAEFLSHPNLTFLLELGTYPDQFPNLFETATDIVVKGWMGPIALYAGGGIALQWKEIADAWVCNQYIHVTAGAQLWLNNSVNITASVSSLDTLPPSWIFSPEVSLGLHFSLCPGRPCSLDKENGFYLWLVVGLIVAGLFVHYQHI